MELARLFPSTSRGCSVVANKRMFDRKASLANVPDKKKKKKGNTSFGRSIKLTICRLPCFSSNIPRGKARKILNTNGRIVDIQVTRSMPATMIKEIINRNFHQFNNNWNYLETGQDNVLAIARDQSPNGDLICSRRGCLYICDQLPNH